MSKYLEDHELSRKVESQKSSESNMQSMTLHGVAKCFFSTSLIHGFRRFQRLCSEFGCTELYEIPT